MMANAPHILVVGGGIVGSSLAYQLTRQRARVTLLGNAVNGATETSFAWLTVAPEAPEAYMAFRQQAIADWHRLENDLNGQLKIDWSGALRWFEDPALTEQYVHKLVGAGCRARLVGQREIRALEPNLKNVPPLALFAEDEGSIDATQTTKLLVEAARQAGASVQPGNEVLSLMTSGSRVTGVVTAAGRLTADMVVLAAGIQTAALCQPLSMSLPIRLSPAILLAFATRRQFVHRIVSSPFMEIRAASGSLTLAADDYVDESAENSPQALAQRTLERIRAHWWGTEDIDLANVSVGQRPIPQDGLPVIGRIAPVGGLYVSVMHAGVTLAAFAGSLIATELIGNQEATLLAPYRPARFTH